MSDALKMARLDQLSIKSPLGMYATLLLVLFILSFVDLSIVVADISAAWVMALNVPAVFLVQEKDGLDRLYASLALSDREIVAGRYIYMFGHYFIALIVATLFSVIVSMLSGESVSVVALAAGVALSMLMFTFIISIQTVIYFTIGFSKGQAWGLIPYGTMLLLVIATVLSDSSMQMIYVLMQWPLVMIFVSLAASAGMIVVSYRSSLKSYRMFH